MENLQNNDKSAVYYCIIGFEHNELMNQAEFYKSISYNMLQTTDNWDEVRLFETLEEAEIIRLELKENYDCYGWYVLMINKHVNY